MPDKKVVTASQIQFELSKVVKIPAEQVAERETENLANLENNIKKEVYGQDEAIVSIVDKILIAQAGLKVKWFTKRKYSSKIDTACFDFLPTARIS